MSQILNDLRLIDAAESAKIQIPKPKEPLK
jgi:hypothetical protein